MLTRRFAAAAILTGASHRTQWGQPDAFNEAVQLGSSRQDVCQLSCVEQGPAGSSIFSSS
jgi:hypothetical protein